jgi:hypothetical protein
MKKTIWIWSLMVVLALSLAGCARDKEPAAAAIKAAEEAFNAAKAEAMQYVPDQVKGIEGAIKSAKENFEKGEYTAALNAAKDLPGKIKELSAAAAAKKADLTKAWEEMSGALPKMLEAIKSRVDILSKSRKLPKDIDKAKLEGAKSGYEMAEKTWNEASEAFKAGNLQDALAKAKTVKEKTIEIMNALGMQLPAAAKG